MVHQCPYRVQDYRRALSHVFLTPPFRLCFPSIIQHSSSGGHERTHVSMRLFIASFMLMQIVCCNHLLARPSVTGKAVHNIGDVGEHYPIFLVEKSHHPENITVVYTKLDKNCHVIPDREHGFMPTLDFYWLMDETRYKPMAGPLKEGVRKRLQFTDTRWHKVDPTSFSVRIDGLVHVKHDLQSPTVQIK